MMIIVTSSFAQKDTNSVDLIRQKFPKIYNVIVNESRARYYSDYACQKQMIENQCLAFSMYFILIYADNPTIPKDVLNDIQVNATGKFCKNCTMDESCYGLTDVIEKADCILSYMVIDWVKVIFEITDQIDAYKSINKPI